MYQCEQKGYLLTVEHNYIPTTSTHRDAAGVFGGLSLRVVEVRRYRHDGLAHWSSQEALRGLLHLRQDHGTDLAAKFGPKLTKKSIEHTEESEGKSQMNEQQYYYGGP